MAICNFGANKLLFLSSFFLHSNHKYLMKRVRKINCIIILHVFFPAKSFSENLTKQIKKERKEKACVTCISKHQKIFSENLIK